MKKKRFIWWTGFTVMLLLFVFSLFKLSGYFLAEKETRKISDELTNLAVTVHEKEKTPISVDFDKLKEKNKNISAWLYSEDTPINYPVMRSKDNNDYLRTLPNGKYNVSGSLFSDFRSSENFTDNINIIYGHNMKNDTMFGTLPDYKDKDYFEAHKILYLLTPSGDYRLTVMEGFVTDVNDEIYSLLGDEEYKTVYLSTCSYDYKDARYVLKCMAEEIE